MAKNDKMIDQKKQVSRRNFLVAQRSPSIDYGVYEPVVNEVPVPPADAEVHPTACEYCIVGCGYKVYRWPSAAEGGPARPTKTPSTRTIRIRPASGKWVSPNMHNVVRHNGELHHLW